MSDMDSPPRRSVHQSARRTSARPARSALKAGASLPMLFAKKGGPSGGDSGVNGVQFAQRLERGLHELRLLPVPANGDGQLTDAAISVAEQRLQLLGLFDQGVDAGAFFLRRALRWPWAALSRPPRRCRRPGSPAVPVRSRSFSCSGLRAMAGYGCPRPPAARWRWAARRFPCPAASRGRRGVRRGRPAASPG